MERPFYMFPRKVVEFGVVDKILWQGQEAIGDTPSPDEWDKRAKIKLVERHPIKTLETIKGTTHQARSPFTGQWFHIKSAIPQMDTREEIHQYIKHDIFFRKTSNVLI
jgi:hypothetical protein